MPRAILNAEGDYDMECGPGCHSKSHTYELNAAITKGTLPEIKAFFGLCHNNGRGKDTIGRTTLHVAASCGRTDVVEWLLSKKQTDIRTRDRESGWTALHRALFYGQLTCARLLIRANSSLTTRDHEGLTPLDLLRLDGQNNWSASKNDPNEVYSWGDNANFTLGQSIDKGRSAPEAIDVFRHNHIHVQQVVMNKYHTVFLTQAGQVYTCGHGQGGRLGHGDQQTCLAPKLVKLGGSGIVIDVATSMDHTFLLTERGKLYSFGMNNFHQMGHLTPETQHLCPKQVTEQTWGDKTRVTHVATARYHTVVCTDSAVFTFGLNAGQLGHIKGDKFVQTARQVSSLRYHSNRPVAVVCSDAAIVCQCEEGNIFLLQGYSCRKIVPKRSDIIKMRVSGGHLDSFVHPVLFKDFVEKDLVIVMLSSTGRVFVWRHGYNSPHVCSWLSRREVLVHDFDLSLTSMILVTTDRSAFVGHFSAPQVSDQPPSPVTPPSRRHRHPDFMSPMQTDDVHLEPVPFVHRASMVAIDDKGTNFMAVQTLPIMGLTDLPLVSETTMVEDLAHLLDETVASDTNCDIIIHVGCQSFAAHRFILCSRCAYFYKLITETQPQKQRFVGHKRAIHLHNVESNIFEQILRFLYTGSCQWLKNGEDLIALEANLSRDVFNDCYDDSSESMDSRVSQSLNYRDRQTKSRQKIVEIGDTQCETRLALKSLRNIAVRWNMTGLMERINTLIGSYSEVTPAEVTRTHVTPMTFQRKKFTEFCDVTIKCDDDQIRRCHSCLLVARVEYFRCMLASDWIETQGRPTIDLHLPAALVDALLDFIYTGHSTIFNDCTNIELLCNVLVVSDQLLIGRLKEKCEASLTELLTFKNACELLEFASLYNAGQLRASCSQFICLNMAVMMEARYVEVLSEEVMDQLSRYYKNCTGKQAHESVFPYADGPGKEFLLRLVSRNTEIHEDYAPLAAMAERKKTRVKRRRSRSKSFGEDTCVESVVKRIVGVGGDCGKTEEKGCEASAPEIVGMTGDCGKMEERNCDGSVVKRIVGVGGDCGKVKEEDCVESVVDSGVNVGETEIAAEIEIQIPAVSTSGHLPPRWPCRDTTNGRRDNDPVDVGSPESAVSLREIMEEERRQRVRCTGSIQLSLKAHSVKHKSWKPLFTQDADLPTEPTVAKLPEKTTQVNPWSTVGALTLSFKDLMKADLEQQKRRRKSSENKDSSSSIVTSPPSPQATERNPAWQGSVRSPAWQGSVRSPETGRVNFSEIVEDERVKTEILNKTRNKPLHLIQLEEKAMEELLAYYAAEQRYDDRITVERVSTLAVTPVWTKRT